MIALKHRHLEIAAVLAVPILTICVLVRSFAAFDLVGVLAVIGGYVVADFLCGAVHWYCDEVADVSWRWIGPAFIRPFRDHHEQPEALVDHDVFELCGNNAIVSSVILVAILPLAASAPHLTIGAAGLAVAVLVTNVFHRWAHTARPSGLVRALQQARLVLCPREHLDHHVALDRAYCVTSGWTNPILDAAVRCVRTLRARRAGWPRT